MSRLSHFYDTVDYHNLESHSDYSYIQICGEIGNQVPLRSINFSHSKFINAQFTEPILIYSKFVRCVGENIRCIGAKLSDGSFSHSQWKNSVFSAVDLAGSTMKKVHFTGCKFMGVNLRFSTCESVVFEDCSLTDVDFSGAVLKNVQFIDTKLDDIHIKGIQMDKVDFRQASYIGKIDDVTGLSGAIFDKIQLLELSEILAISMGIIIGQDANNYSGRY